MMPKKEVVRMLAHIGLAALLLATTSCAGGFSSVQKDKPVPACENQCDDIRTECIEGCADNVSDDDSGEGQDTTLCEATCDESRDQCIEACGQGDQNNTRSWNGSSPISGYN